jgi:hypothetical protein
MSSRKCLLTSLVRSGVIEIRRVWTSRAETERSRYLRQTFRRWLCWDSMQRAPQLATPTPYNYGDGQGGQALKSQPTFAEFTFATIAADDAKVQDHARQITERHGSKGLFSVHVVGWDEFVRKLTKRPALIEKHYGYVANSAIRDEVRKVPVETPGLSGARQRGKNSSAHLFIEFPRYPTTAKK